MGGGGVEDMAKVNDPGYNMKSKVETSVGWLRQKLLRVNDE